MTKVTIDIEKIKESLSNIGYAISDFLPRDNNGKNWQFKFKNSGAVVTVYDTNKKRNTVVNGRCEDGEQGALKNIVDALKCEELSIDPLNAEIVSLINSKKEDSFYDFKEQWPKGDALLHDILCLANNTDGRDGYLIVGVKDTPCEVVGVDDWRKSHEIYDLLKSKNFAGGHMPEVELKRVMYKCHKIDVLLIKKSKHVPFYLEDKSGGVLAHQIYTRVGDTNTPKNGHASYGDVEKLWRIHFDRETQ